MMNGQIEQGTTKDKSTPKTSTQKPPTKSHFIYFFKQFCMLTMQVLDTQFKTEESPVENSDLSYKQKKKKHAYLVFLGWYCQKVISSLKTNNPN